MKSHYCGAIAVATAAFLASPTAALQSRRMVAHVLTTACDDPELRADAELTISELVTNASKSNSSDITVTLVASPEGIHIEVTDQDSSGVFPQDTPAVDAEHGRGLMIVQQLSTRWGWEATGAGKRVWADLDSQCGLSDPYRPSPPPPSEGIALTGPSPSLTTAS
ncbi:ATP-binding protein [Streptomyces sp. ME01-18a]|uniref:ATP-binding protein n=1 Tax=Streptomyces sp. ME01-18a TaxID=3028669 RepID=UPI0029BF46A1|nr:ATP-binding protein [Streptomyces sp. ME01-18a]MDX3433939.1 ATP-binding protein [Streptomyces sp. ME01-18a]